MSVKCQMKVFIAFFITLTNILGISSILSGRSRNCTLTELYGSGSTAELKAWYFEVLGTQFNEPKLPYDETLQDRLFGNLTCGQPVIDVTKAIIDGQDAPEKAWPWHVLLLVNQGNFSTLCGASLISNYWILTAAHCIGDHQAKYTIVLGARDIYNNFELNRKYRTAQKVIVHKDFNPVYKKIDIALIKLNEEVTFTDYIRPICLPKVEEKLLNDDICYTTGWGSTNSSDPSTPKILQQLKINIMPVDLCTYTFATKHVRISSDRLCVDLIDDIKGLCQGDSGGAASCRLDGSFVIYGINSLAPTGCSYKWIPGLLTRVTDYMDWIVTNIADN